MTTIKERIDALEADAAKWSSKPILAASSAIAQEQAAQLRRVLALVEAVGQDVDNFGFLPRADAALRAMESAGDVEPHKTKWVAETIHYSADGPIAAGDIAKDGDAE